MSELYTALAKFQAQSTTIPKTAQGYGYKYTPLDKIWDYIRKPLSECGLSVVQIPVSDPSSPTTIGVRTILAHSAGETIDGVCWARVESKKGLSEAQCIGIAITYLRRYGLSAVLGLTTDEDTDAAPLPHGAPSYKASAEPPKGKTDVELARDLAAKIDAGKGTLEAALEYAEKQGWSQQALDVLNGVVE